MPEKAGSLEVISKMFAAAGFTGKTFTEQLAAMFLQMDKFGESKKELEAFPGIFKDASLAVGEMFRDLRAQKTEAVLGDMFPTLGDFSQFSRAMEKFHEQLGKMNLTQEQLTFNTTEFIQQWREATIAADLGKFRRELDDADRAAAEGILAYLKAIDDETMMMGMSNKERVRAIDLLRLEEIRGNLTSSAYDRLAGTLELARQKQEALNGSWAFGAKAALNEYLNVVRNVADHIGEMFSNGFRMAEDALINFTSTGKLEIRDFATYVIRELLRMQIREHILGPLTQVLRGLIPGAAGATSGSSLVNLGYADPNSNWGGIGYVPRDMLSMVHKGERVITASENRRGMSSGGGGGGGGITVINHNTFGPGVDTGQIAIMLAQNRRLTIATVEKMMYRGEPISRMRR
jgi:lambda family phage tail tape measure protein